MKQKFTIALIFLLTFLNNSDACTIFMANDGQQVWIGNNEDEAPSLTYRLWYYPAANKSYGYMLWTELTNNQKLNTIIYKNPQGGMNAWGLFMDYTAIDDTPALQDPNKQNREEEVVTDILKQCRTVSEALRYIAQFNLVRLTGAQLFIGDAIGDYATVHGAYVIGRNTKNFALTNYGIKDGYHEACWRRDIATQCLKEDKTYGLNDIVDILKKTTQKKPSNLTSNYSMAINLKTQTIHLYYKNDFTVQKVISLGAELKKGKHYKDMVSYFPLPLRDVILKKYAAGGINSAIATYKYLRKNFPKKYNFSNNDAVDLTIEAIANGQTKDAVLFLECLKRYEPNKTLIDTWLGVAYRRLGNIKQSNVYFTRTFAKDPNNYVATLFGKQQDHKITFKMNDFEGATQVSLIGDFSKWQAIPMKKENDRWTCQVSIPTGDYNYKFIVNKEYLADQLNLLNTGSGPKIYSKLYVW